MAEPYTSADTDNSITSGDLNRTYRDTFDLGVAITSHMRRTAAESLPTATAGEAPEEPEATGSDIAIATPQRLSAKRRLFQLPARMARPLLLPFYRAAKPVLRPIVGRVRRSLLEQLFVEMHTNQAILRAEYAHLQQQQAITDAMLEQLQAALATSFQTSLQTSRQVVANQETIQRQLRNPSRTLLDQVAPYLARIEQYSATTSKRIAINCGPNEVLVRTEAGYVVCAATDVAVLTALIELGDLERGTRLLIERFLRPGNVFVDVGANLGLHTVAAARAMHRTGRIFAFEPFTPTMRLLQKSLLINGCSNIVETHVAAVSNHTGSHTLFLGMISGHHSLYPLTELAQAEETAVDVPLVTLDSVLPPDICADLIKIDVEGAEMDVIAGAQSVIERNPEIALIVEFGPSHLARTGHTAANWLQAFERLGLVYQVIDPETGALERWTLEQLAQVDSANLFFARPGADAWKKAMAH